MIEAGFDPPAPGIAVVAPFDFALDDEYWRWVAHGVRIYATRTPYLDVDVSVEMAEAVSETAEVTAAGRAVSVARPGAVVYACTSGSFVAGLAGERRLRAALAEAAGAPAVTTSGALLDALDALSVRRVAIGTPYDAQVTARLTAFLDEAGYAVPGDAYLGLHADIARVDAATVRDLARAADRPDADAVFLSCTNLRTFGLLAALEDELGKPVLSANQVSIWAALRLAGLPAAATGERLFAAAASHAR
jgi:maleate isomerase